MTYGVSLSLWDKRGISSREVEILLALSRLYDKVSIIMYGDVSDLRYRNSLLKNTECIDKFHEK